MITINEFENFLKNNNYSNEVVVENEKIFVAGSLYIRETNITEIPDNLTVGGDLDISGTNITEIPDNLTVGGDLDISGTNITEIPDNLTVGGSLDLGGTNITELPNNLTVGRSLYLSETNITEIPDNLTIGGNLYGFNGDIMSSVKKLKRGYNKELRYIFFDGILWGNVKSVKKVEDKIIYKTPLGYCVEEKDLTAHGKTLKEAMEDLQFKKTKSEEIKNIIPMLNKDSGMKTAYKSVKEVEEQ